MRSALIQLLCCVITLQLSPPLCVQGHRMCKAELPGSLRFKHSLYIKPCLQLKILELKIVSWIRLRWAELMVLKHWTYIFIFPEKAFVCLMWVKCIIGVFFIFPLISISLPRLMFSTACLLPGLRGDRKLEQKLKSLEVWLTVCCGYFQLKC